MGSFRGRLRWKDEHRDATRLEIVERAVPRRRDEPRARAPGDPVARPALRRGQERLLRGFLGEVEVAEEADQRSEDTAPLVAEGPLEWDG